MKVVVPFALSSPWALQATKLALRQDGIEAIYEHMVGDEAYFNLLANLWKTKNPFTIVEHDIVVHPGAIQELENCHELFCTFPYYCSVGWIEDGLGCTKFSDKLMETYPNFFKEPFPDCCMHTKYYCGLDRLVAHRMEQLSIKPHVHSPGVVNLNERWT